MNLGAILNLIMVLALNVPVAIGIIEDSIKKIEAASGTKAKLQAVTAMLEAIIKEVEDVISGL